MVVGFKVLGHSSWILKKKCLQPMYQESQQNIMFETWLYEHFQNILNDPFA